MTVRSFAIGLFVAPFCSGTLLLGAPITYDLSSDWEDILSSGNDGSTSWSIQYNTTAMTVGGIPYWGLPGTPNDASTSLYSIYPVGAVRISQFWEDNPVGSIIAHVPYDSSNHDRIVWTSPIDGNVNIDAELWHPENIGHASRSTTWRILFDNEVLATGTFGGTASGKQYIGPNDPLRPGIPEFEIVAGQTIILDFCNGNDWDYPAFVGMNLAITIDSGTPIPEPMTIILMGCTFAAPCIFRRRRTT